MISAPNYRSGRRIGLRLKSQNGVHGIATAFHARCDYSPIPGTSQVVELKQNDGSIYLTNGAIMERAYASGNPQNVEYDMQTATVPPGGAYMVELTIPDAGLCPFVTHSFADASKGALGLLKLATSNKRQTRGVF